MKKLLDYIFLLRPMLIIPVWTVALLGVRAASWRERGIGPFQFDHYPFTTFTTFDLNLLLMLLLGTLLTGAIFILNQIYDIDSDKENHKLFLLAENHVSIAEARGLYWVLTVVAVAGTFFLNWQLGVLFVFGAWLGFQYSVPRFKVRENAYKAFRNNIIGHGMTAFMFGWVMFTNFNVEGVLKSLPYVFAVGAVYLTTTLPDLRGDTEVAKTTYAVEWGVAKTLKNATWMVALSLVLSILAADYGFSLAAAIALPLYFFAAIRQSVEFAVLAGKIAILGLSLLAAVYFPLYLVVLLLTFTLTRIYYARRFGMAYPVLSGGNN
jgi:4-hydroxybenzoate polyprenyltransferase